MATPDDTPRGLGVPRDYTYRDPIAEGAASASADMARDDWTVAEIQAAKAAGLLSQAKASMPGPTGITRSPVVWDPTMGGPIPRLPDLERMGKGLQDVPAPPHQLSIADAAARRAQDVAN